MKEFNGYDFLKNECIKFCREHGNTFLPIMALIESPVLGRSVIYCDSWNDFDEWLYDWWEGGEVKILFMEYADKLVDEEYERRCKNDSMRKVR